MTPHQTAEEFIVAALKADSTVTTAVSGRIFTYAAPPGTAFPYIIVQPQSDGKDIGAIGAHRIMTNLSYTVKVVSDGPFVDIDPVCKAIDTVLHATQGETADGRVFGIIRRFPISYIQPADGGSLIRHRGGVYYVSAK